MLTRQLAIADYDAGRILPDRLTRQSHRQYLGYAERMLHVYRNGVGRTRRELHRAVWTVFAEEEDCPARRIDAFCKLLDDVSAYQRDRRGRAAALRREVFHLAAVKHPLVRRADRLFESEEAMVKRDIASQLGRPWREIDQELFADVIEFHRLAKFEGYADGLALLARYNVAQVQQAKIQTLRTFADRRILLAVADQVKDAVAELPTDVVTYKTALRINDVLQRLNPTDG